MFGLKMEHTFIHLAQTRYLSEYDVFETMSMSSERTKWNVNPDYIFKICVYTMYIINYQQQLSLRNLIHILLHGLSSSGFVYIF